MEMIECTGRLYLIQIPKVRSVRKTTCPFATGRVNPSTVSDLPNFPMGKNESLAAEWSNTSRQPSAPTTARAATATTSLRCFSPCVKYTAITIGAFAGGYNTAIVFVVP